MANTIKFCLSSIWLAKGRSLTIDLISTLISNTNTDPIYFTYNIAIGIVAEILRKQNHFFLNISAGTYIELNERECLMENTPIGHSKTKY